MPQGFSGYSGCGVVGGNFQFLFYIYIHEVG